jgi:hypothetical protein
MKQLFSFFTQILLLLVFIFSIKTAHAAVNYKLTSLVGRYEGNWSSWVDKRLAVFEMYVDWCNNSIGWFFPLDVNGTWNRGSVPLISWAPIECGGRYQPGITKLISNGTFDIYINEFSDRLKKWLAGPDGIYGTDDDRRAYLRLGMKFEKIGYSDRKNMLFACHENALKSNYDLVIEFKNYVTSSECRGSR